MAQLQSIKLFDLFKRRLKQRANDEEGSVLVEFGLLAFPFFALVAVILETAFTLLASQILDAALEDASRYVRTGQAHTNAYSLTEFRAKVCEDLYGLFDCAQLKIYVTPITNFSSANINQSVVDLDDGSWTETEAYNHGSASEVMLARAYYQWPAILNIMPTTAHLVNNTVLLSSARLFRNEPF